MPIKWTRQGWASYQLESKTLYLHEGKGGQVKVAGWMSVAVPAAPALPTQPFGLALTFPPETAKSRTYWYPRRPKSRLQSSEINSALMTARNWDRTRLNEGAGFTKLTWMAAGTTGASSETGRLHRLLSSSWAPSTPAPGGNFWSQAAGRKEWDPLLFGC